MVKKTKKDIHAQQDVREAGVAETGVETPGTAPEDLQAPTVDRELEEKARECAENYDKYLRAVAELDNYRKRAAKEKADAIKYGNESLIRELLPLADSLERALQHADKSNDFESFKKGLGMLKDQLLCCLGKHGVEPIDCADKQFDPNYHEALMQVTSREHDNNQIVDELEKGYLLNGRLLRPAKVTVCKRPDDNGTC
ncbi:MAG TPA: nucleotide exchange factor GrpE [Syntrophales bacterium]|nr:nucleotide exchange factor GrpE [Syntrophales bacterium]